MLEEIKLSLPKHYKPLMGKHNRACRSHLAQPAYYLYPEKSSYLKIQFFPKPHFNSLRQTQVDRQMRVYLLRHNNIVIKTSFNACKNPNYKGQYTDEMKTHE